MYSFLFIKSKLYIKDEDEEEDDFVIDIIMKKSYIKKNLYFEINASLFFNAPPPPPPPRNLNKRPRRLIEDLRYPIMKEKDTRHFIPRDWTFFSPVFCVRLFWVHERTI